MISDRMGSVMDRQLADQSSGSSSSISGQLSGSGRQPPPEPQPSLQPQQPLSGRPVIVNETSVLVTEPSDVPLGIFWDIENCLIPLTKSAAGVVNRIRQFVAERHPECGFAKEFTCCCDSKRLPDLISDGLNRQGVTVAHVNSTAKNAADDKLAELVDAFVDNCRPTGGRSPVLVLITGDINFAKTIRNANRKHITVVLIYGNYCSPDLKLMVKESYAFTDVIDGVPIATASQELTQTFHLKVGNLPVDRPIKDIVARLSRLTSNCGGKPVNLIDGKALVEFGCKDDAIRALQRISGEDCFGQPIDVKLIDNLQTSTEAQEFNICKSIITGLYVMRGDNDLTEIIQQMIVKWEDFNINSRFIVNVDQQSDQSLIVTAITPEANQKLMTSALNHLIPDIKWTQMDGYTSGLGWTLKKQEPVADNRRSVIKGFKTSKDDNVLEIIKEFVNSWRDRIVTGDYIVSVERNTKQTNQGLDAKVNLFVTAVDADASKALVKAANYHLKVNCGIKWRRYIHRNRTYSDDVDYNYNCKSVIKGLVTRSNKNITEYVRKIVDDWNDIAVTGRSIVNVETNTRTRHAGDAKVNLFVTAISPKASQALVMGAKRHIRPEHKIRWTRYQARDVSRHSDTTTTQSMTTDDTDGDDEDDVYDDNDSDIQYIPYSYNSRSSFLS